MPIIFKKKMKGDKGFTLLETVITVALGTVVAMLILAIVSPGMKEIRNLKKDERLHSNAIFLINNLNYWIKQGKYLDVPNQNTLRVIMPDSTAKEIVFINNSITIDGKGLFNPNEIETTNLSFAKMQKSVRINFAIQIKDSSENNFSIATTIAQRNNP